MKQIVTVAVIGLTFLQDCMASCKNGDVKQVVFDTPIINNYKLTATGQTALYSSDGAVISNITTGSAFYGQDANYSKGSTMAYKDNGNGTVTDANTGLMWQQVPPSAGYTWQKAVDYCNSLKLGGYSDWWFKSPTATDASKTGPAIKCLV